MSLSQLGIKDCKIEMRKYVLVSQPSRWQQKRERVVVQSPMLNIPKDVTLVPVKRFNGEEQNLVCFLPRKDIERDSSDTDQRLHVSQIPSSIEAHGTAMCDNSPSDDFLYVRSDRFWIYVNSSTDGYTDKVPVINLRTYQSGAVPVDHVCWFPKIRSTSWCPETHARREQLWTPGGPTRKLKLSGSKNYALWSFVVCQFTDGSKPIAKSVKIPAKDDQGQENYYLSLSESGLFFEARRRCMMEELQGDSELQLPAFLLPTPPASPELEIIKSHDKGKENQSSPLNSVPIDKIDLVWARIKDMATRRASPNNHYVLQNSPIHPQRSQSVEASESRGRSASIKVPTVDYNSDSSSSWDSTSSDSRDSSPTPDPYADFEYLRKAREGQRVNGGIILNEMKSTFQANEDLADRPNRLAFSAADPSIASDPTLIRANWEANRPGHNPKLDNLCQDNDPNCRYITKYTCKHFHPDAAKCLLDKQPLLEFYDPSPANLSKQWKAWTEANRAAPQQDRHADHEHCITRLRPYPAGAGDCMLAGNPLRNHVCCLWVPADLDGLAQNFTRAYNKWKLTDAERHRVQIFNQSTLVKTETRLMDFGIRDDQLGWGGKTLQLELDEGAFGDELEYLDMDKEMLVEEEGQRDVEHILRELGVPS